MTDFIDVGDRHVSPWEELDRETFDLGEPSEPLTVDFADEHRAWLQLSQAGVLRVGVGPRHLREAHEEVEKQREAEEWAEAVVRDWSGTPAPARHEPAELSERRHSDPSSQNACERAEALARAYGVR